MERGKDDGCEGEMMVMGRSTGDQGSQFCSNPCPRGEFSRKSSNKPLENWAGRSDTLMWPEASQSFLSPSCRGQTCQPSSPGEVVCCSRAS